MRMHDHNGWATALYNNSTFVLYQRVVWFSAADAFVLPTRGEGWGLPIAEAMAMGVPVLVTNHSGPTAFATDDNAYLISVLPERDHYAYAQPDVDVLAQLMRQVVVDSKLPVDISPAAVKAIRARETMEALSPAVCAQAMVQRLRQQARWRGWIV
jgi:glycosyltransferase involved in cell wall biosynthesis